MPAHPTTVLVGLRPRGLWPIALALAPPTWAAMGWGVVLARPVPGVPLWAVWAAFVIFGVGLPALAWTASGRLILRDDTIQLDGLFGRTQNIAAGDLAEVVARRRSVGISQKDGSTMRLLCSQPPEVAEAIKRLRNPNASQA